MPKTQTISVREFRQNLSLYLRASHVNNIQFVIMRHSKPVARIIPTERRKTQKQLRAELISDLRKAEKRMTKGEYLTTSQLRKRLGLGPSPFSGIRKRKGS